MKYDATITGIGKDAAALFEASNMLIIFREEVPEDLAAISVLHNGKKLLETPKTGDTVIICKKEFRISAIGDKALETLETLGHCTICFNGGTEATLPGYIMLEGVAIAPSDITIGGQLKII